MADKIVVLDAGVVQQVGSPIELYQRPTNLFVAGFFGSPKMNFVEVTVEAVEPGFITISSKDVASLRVPARSVGVNVSCVLTLGVRPHDLSPANSGAIVGRVSLVELLGNETTVNLELSSGAAWLAVLEGDQPLRVGESLALSAEPAKAILFDKDGKSLLEPLS